jgi:hypothetical protein
VIRWVHNTTLYLEAATHFEVNRCMIMLPMGIQYNILEGDVHITTSENATRNNTVMFDHYGRQRTSRSLDCQRSNEILLVKAGFTFM